MTERVAELARSLLNSVESRGVILLLGATDTGKSTLAGSIANEAIAAGVATAIVDADVGQSELGPPGTLGMAMPGEAIESIGGARPTALAFVGSNTPMRHLLPIVVGTRRLVDEARRRGADLVVVDTCGLIDGDIGRALKLHKVDLLAPDLVVGLQRRDELEPILQLAEAGARVARVAVPDDVPRKSPALRRSRRQSRLFHYFQGATPLTLDVPAVPLAGAWLFQSEALDPRYLRLAEKSIGKPVLYGERAGKCVRLVTTGVVTARVKPQLQEALEVSQLLVTSPQSFQGLMVGLIAAGNTLAAVGMLEEVAFDSRRLSIRTPLSSAASVVQVRLGRLRLRRDGTEIGLVRPEEL